MNAYVRFSCRPTVRRALSLGKTLEQAFITLNLCNNPASGIYLHCTEELGANLMRCKLNRLIQTVNLQYRFAKRQTGVNLCDRCPNAEKQLPQGK